MVRFLHGIPTMGSWQIKVKTNPDRATTRLGSLGEKLLSILSEHASKARTYPAIPKIAKTQPEKVMVTRITLSTASLVGSFNTQKISTALNWHRNAISMMGTAVKRSSGTAGYSLPSVVNASEGTCEALNTRTAVKRHTLAMPT